MGKAYSVDLRLRVLAALDSGVSKMQVHKTFQVSRSTIDDWLLLREQTGRVQDVPRRQSARRGLAAQESFGAFVQRHQHSTLEQMRQVWQRQTQQSLSTMSFSRALHQMGYTRKKRVISTASGDKQNAKPSRSR